MKRVFIVVAIIGFTLALRSGALGQQATVTVPGSWSASGWWVDTGLSLTAGTQVKVTASGSWTPWWPYGYCGPDGFSASTGQQFYGDQFFSPNGESGQGTVALGALIGYAGATPPAVGSYASMSSSQIQDTLTHLVALGSSTTFTMPYTGELFLGMNDDAYSAYASDNIGSVLATVIVVPEPSALAVLACGLGGMALFVRPRRA